MMIYEIVATLFILALVLLGWLPLALALLGSIMDAWRGLRNGRTNQTPTPNN